MPRRAYIADLKKAIEGVDIAGIHNVRCGNDDGEFTFQCVIQGGECLEISALIPDVSEYPSTHSYMIFAPQDAPAIVADCLADISDNFSMGKTVSQVLELVSHRLGTIDKDGDREMLDSSDFDQEGYDVSDEEDVDEDYFPDDEMGDRHHILHETGTSLSATAHMGSTSALKKKIQHDLRVAKDMGFRIGAVGNPLQGTNCYVSLSCRISKLGISREAMKAWDLEPSDYVIVILHYPHGYKSMESVLAMRDTNTFRQNFGVKIGVSKFYRPTAEEAIGAFTTVSKGKEKNRDPPSESVSSSGKETGFRNCFISRPLNDGLFPDQFYSILKIRNEHTELRWDGAEAYHNDSRGTLAADVQSVQKHLYQAMNSSNAEYPSIVTSDHLRYTEPADQSLPLVAMQFALRHFVRCTEFCLICFSKLPNDIQALKPYVCDNPLCLYQYMRLGFGPSIEHEILSQPKVVDLLISFCYRSARDFKLKDFPSGMGLMVPPLEALDPAPASSDAPRPFVSPWVTPAIGPAQAPPVAANPVPVVSPIYTSLNEHMREMIFPDKSQPCPVRTGQWIALKETKNRGPTGGPIGFKTRHCRVEDTTFWPTVKLSPFVYPKEAEVNPDHGTTTKKSDPAPQPGYQPATFYIYDRNFDDFGEDDKRHVICAMLALLPTVEEMRDYLSRSAQLPLSSWVERLPPAVLGILRWIIASNRACIMQVDDDDSSGEERLYGMPGWTQFRFAMGAPDKERRFAMAVRDTVKRKNPLYPTLFAWHGSPLFNWHSIIREGLHFKRVAHGRAYGHGVYHALETNVALSYTGGQGNAGGWPGSQLNMTQALALNEIVNAPSEFVSSHPYLVVNQLDWIQTRYLFIKTGSDIFSDYKASKDPPKVQALPPKDCIEMDELWTPRGMNGTPLLIPKAALATSRHVVNQSTSLRQLARSKFRRTSKGTERDPITIDGDDDDNASVATLDEDRAIFDDFDDEVEIIGERPATLSFGAKGFIAKLKGDTKPKSSTGFEPGTLDYSQLPIMKPPSWASPQTTNRLMKDFQALLKSQNKKKPGEEFFYVDPERIENMYQWIVELHNFDPSLPLTKDMKDRKIPSIVLEMRFGPDYPMTPPFVRVIRPRFRAFMHGGGGHVTIGGAMCMELLTNTGWSAALSLESVLLVVFMAISSKDPPARLESIPHGFDRHGHYSAYGIHDAIAAYIRACNSHGWKVPPGFQKMAYGGADEY